MLKVTDLFSGIGGFSLGLERTGHFRTTSFCEIEDVPRKVLQSHWAHVPVHRDITKLTLTPEIGSVYTGGFPCQDISIAKSRGNGGKGLSGARSGLWYEYLRLIKQGRPQYVIIENVHNLLSKGLGTIVQNLAEIGYDTAYTTYDSQWFGTPQRRRRVYIVGFRDGIAPESDFFECLERTDDTLRRKMEAITASRVWYSAQGGGVGKEIAFFTRQRSDEFKATGLSGTLAKRDHKSYTDLVVEDGVVRRVCPEERMRLQGFPHDWLECVSAAPKSEHFKCNGMTTNVVEYIGRLLHAYNEQYGGKIYG